ncbi:hypothetical protein C8039_12710 [Halogeometricum sp. wsp3]|nr:hypothetical protein C8039_12710 [Halogeometricum sp. wsp3]
MSNRLVENATIEKSNCRHCGAHVSRDFRRTFGDGDDIAHRCADCDCMPRFSGGLAGDSDTLTRGLPHPFGCELFSLSDGGEKSLAGALNPLDYEPD